MNLSRSSPVRFAFPAAAIGGLAVLVGMAATVRLELNQAQNLWLGALCLLLAPSLVSNTTKQQAAIGGILVASGLAVASEAFGADPSWTNPLTLVLLGASIAVQMRPADFTWLIPGSGISLIVLVAVSSVRGQPTVEPATGLAGAMLAVLACSSALATSEWDTHKTLATAACLGLATMSAIVASLDASRVWVTCSILLVGSSIAIRILFRTDRLNRAARVLPLHPHMAVVSAVGVAAGSALLVAVSTANTELQWPIIAIVGSGLVGIGSVALCWRTAFGDQVQQFERARLESRIDALTGLPNRRAAQERLQDEIARSIRYDHPLSLLMIDLDDFKSINDRFGHTAGDDALSLTAQSISSSIRSIDLAGRYGGEEFLVILPETTELGAEIVAERIRSSIEDAGRVTASIGLASLADKTTDPSNLIDRADAALYNAKHSGKNRVALFA